MEKDCNNCRFELYNPDEIPCKDCGMDDREYWMPKPQTNADRIRAMSDEELADDLMSYNCLCERCLYANECEADDYVTAEKCREGILEWLKQPAEGE